MSLLPRNRPERESMLKAHGVSRGLAYSERASTAQCFAGCSPVRVRWREQSSSLRLITPRQSRRTRLRDTGGGDPPRPPTLVHHGRPDARPEQNYAIDQGLLLAPTSRGVRLWVTLVVDALVVRFQYGRRIQRDHRGVHRRPGRCVTMQRNVSTTIRVKLHSLTNRKADLLVAEHDVPDRGSRRRRRPLLRDQTAGIESPATERPERGHRTVSGSP